MHQKTTAFYGWKIFHCFYIPQLFYSFIYFIFSTFGYYEISANMDIVLVQVFEFSFLIILSLYLSGITVLYNFMFNFMKDCQTISTMAESFYISAWSPDVKSWLIGKDPDAGKDWSQEKGTTEDEMAGWHHLLNVYEFEQVLGDSEEQGSLACYSPWGHKESHDWAIEPWPASKRHEFSSFSAFLSNF